MKSKILDKRELCDLELIMDKSFYPLDGFLTKVDYISVLESMRLKNGLLFPIPVCLSINQEEKDDFSGQEKIILKDETGIDIAYLYVDDIYEYDLKNECEKVFGCYDLNHPYQKVIKGRYDRGEIFYLGGRVKKIRNVLHYDFNDLRKTPEQIKHIIQEKNIDKLVAFQTRNPMHRSHYHLTINSLETAGEKFSPSAPTRGWGNPRRRYKLSP